MVAAAQQSFLRITASIDPATPTFPSIAARHPAANWFEREVMDFFGLTPQGHPNLARVALHDDWPDGCYALRKDFPYEHPVPRVAGDFHPFRPVTGEGVFQVPVGPVHAGIIEPGHFRFGVAGEPVLYLQMRLFYAHKGTEKRFESMPWRHGLFLAQSISGDTAVGHALAHAHAIERLAGMTVPPRGSALRIVLLELERLYNHTADIGAVATDVAFTVPASRAQAMRERLVRLQSHLFGSRLLRGTVAFGGVPRDLTADGPRHFARTSMSSRRSSASSSRRSSIREPSPTGSTARESSRSGGPGSGNRRHGGASVRCGRRLPPGSSPRRVRALASKCPSKKEETSGRG